MIQITRRERLLAIGAAAVIAVWTVNALALKPAAFARHAVLPEKTNRDPRDGELPSLADASSCRQALPEHGV
jgi:hypothetical protein